MFIKRGSFLIQICKRSSLCLCNRFPILNFSASSKLPSQLPPPNPPPVMEPPTTTPRSETKQQFASSQALPPGSPPGTNKEGVTNYENNQNLWNNVVVLKCESSSESGSCDVYLVGTCHISTGSCKEVQAVMKHIKPQVVFLELCPDRFKSCLDDTAQARKVPPMQQIMTAMWKKKKANAFGIALSCFYKMVGEKLNVIPGAEFRVAYEEARSYGAKIVLGDRPAHITLQRISRNISLWHWAKCAYHILFRSELKQNSKYVGKMMKAINYPESLRNMVTEMNNAESLRKMVEGMNDPDMVKFMNQELSKANPALAEILINERDMYMSASLLEVSKNHSSVVAVVGRGHVEGIVKYWKRPIDTKRLMEIPTKSVGIFRYHASISTGLALAASLYFICMRIH